MAQSRTGRSLGFDEGHERPALGLHDRGRIGRAVFRQYVDHYGATIAGANEVNADRLNLEYLLRYDSVYRRWIQSELPSQRNGKTHSCAA